MLRSSVAEITDFNKLLFFFSTKVNSGRMFTVLQNSATIHLNFTINLKAR